MIIFEKNGVHEDTPLTLCNESTEIVFTICNGLLKNLLYRRQRKKFVEVTECTGFDHTAL